MQPLILLFHAMSSTQMIFLSATICDDLPQCTAWDHVYAYLTVLHGILRIFTTSKASIGHSGYSNSSSSKFEHCAEPKWTVTALVSRFVFANLAGNETLQLESA